MPQLKCLMRNRAKAPPHLPSVIEPKLLNQVAQIARHRGQAVESFWGFFCPLTAFRSELRDLSGRFGDLARSRRLLCRCRGDQLDLLLDSLRSIDDLLQALPLIPRSVLKSRVTNSRVLLRSGPRFPHQLYDEYASLRDGSQSAILPFV